MPSKARIDTPGALPHGIVRGIERKVIFYDPHGNLTSATAPSGLVEYSCDYNDDLVIYVQWPYMTIGSVYYHFARLHSLQSDYPIKSPKCN